MLSGRFRASSNATASRSSAGKVKTYPAPTKGWIANANLAVGEPLGAAILENWFPTSTGVEMRSGHQIHATFSSESSPVESLFSYRNGVNRALFAASETSIYDVTTPLSAVNIILSDENGNELEDDVGNLVGASSLGSPAVSGLTSGQWVSTQFATPGGVFLRLVNGSDAPRVYDGAAFVTTPAVTGVSGGANTLSYVWSFKNRLWFIKKGTLDAYYLTVDALGGAATAFPLGAQFPLGGELLFGASWSLDENSGLSASCVFVTTEGEAAVYQGSNPADVNDWQLKGVYRIGRPLGPHAWMRAGGDLIIATDIGFISLFQAVSKDFAALSPGAVSYPIEDAWNREIKLRPSGYWQVKVWPAKQRSIIALPKFPNQRPEMFAVNVRTGAWCNYTGIQQSYAMELFDDRMFFGSDNGRVMEMEVTGYDIDGSYTATCLPLFDDFKAPGAFKQAGAVRAVFLAPDDPKEFVFPQFDYKISLPASPSAFLTPSADVWGQARWGAAAWGAGRTKQVWQKWQGISGTGYSITAGVQVTSGSIPPPDVDLVRIDVLAQTGEAVA